MACPEVGKKFPAAAGNYEIRCSTRGFVGCTVTFMAEAQIETVEERLDRQRAEQGLPPTLEDPVVIERLAVIVEEHDRRTAGDD
jgi:galactokinase